MFLPLLKSYFMSLIILIEFPSYLNLVIHILLIPLFYIFLHMVVFHFIKWIIVKIEKHIHFSILMSYFVHPDKPIIS